jgi:hypothetical protein
MTNLCDICSEELIYLTVPSRADDEEQPLVRVCPVHGEHYRTRWHTKQENITEDSWILRRDMSIVHGSGLAKKEYGIKPSDDIEYCRFP